MPTRPPTPCAQPGCPALVPAGQRYCAEHARAERRRYDRERGSAASRGYDARWRRLRAMVLAREPLCRACAVEGRVTPATDVDHIVPRSRGGTDVLDNLQPLCHRHHSEKTAREDGGFGREG
ncbi:MAG: HNH endonuclease [Firmicutes bacterium]|nr:HNH endonuclease [Bacillota bacterium]MBE3590835.1 HNH endonuclease [Bacillota bacterium]